MLIYLSWVGCCRTGAQHLDEDYLLRPYGRTHRPHLAPGACLSSGSLSISMRRHSTMAQVTVPHSVMGSLGVGVASLGDEIVRGRGTIGGLTR